MEQQVDEIAQGEHGECDHDDEMDAKRKAVAQALAEVKEENREEDRIVQELPEEQTKGALAREAEELLHDLLGFPRRIGKQPMLMPPSQYNGEPKTSMSGRLPAHTPTTSLQA